jgi:hypothetical protein
MHDVDRTVQIEVPPEVLAEVALRTSKDADRTEIRDVLTDHIDRDIECVTTDGSRAVDAILSDD